MFKSKQDGAEASPLNLVEKLRNLPRLAKISVIASILALIAVFGWSRYMEIKQQSMTKGAKLTSTIKPFGESRLPGVPPQAVMPTRSSATTISQTPTVKALAPTSSATAVPTAAVKPLDVSRAQLEKVSGDTTEPKVSPSSKISAGKLAEITQVSEVKQDCKEPVKKKPVKPRKIKKKPRIQPPKPAGVQAKPKPVIEAIEIVRQPKPTSATHSDCEDIGFLTRGGENIQLMQCRGKVYEVRK